MANFLETLVGEWYSFKGYHVKRGTRVGLRPNGGYDDELDIVAYHPGLADLVHIEASMDTHSWTKRELRYRKKFDAGRRHAAGLFGLPDGTVNLRQMALLAYGSLATHETIGGGQVVPIGAFMNELRSELIDRPIEQQAVPEEWPLVRALQFAARLWPVADRSAGPVGMAEPGKSPRAGRTDLGIGKLARELIVAHPEWRAQQVADEIIARIPGAHPTDKSVRWYMSDMRRAGCSAKPSRHHALNGKPGRCRGCSRGQRGMNARKAAAVRAARFAAYTIAVVELAHQRKVKISPRLLSDGAWKEMVESDVPLEEALRRVTVKGG